MLLHTLNSLWDALNVPQDDVDRELFGRLMSGPSRLHQSAIDQVILTNRAEECRASLSQYCEVR